MAGPEKDKDQAEMATQGHLQPTPPYGTPEPLAGNKFELKAPGPD